MLIQAHELMKHGEKTPEETLAMLKGEDTVEQAMAIINFTNWVKDQQGTDLEDTLSKVESENIAEKALELVKEHPSLALLIFKFVSIMN